MIYLDSAATSFYKPKQVEQAVCCAFHTIGNAGRGAHAPTLEASRVLYRTRAKLARLFHAESASRIAFTANVTQALNMAIDGLLHAGDHVVTTVCEHNSVLRPLYKKQENGVFLTIVSADENGIIDPQDVQNAMRENTRAIVMHHASNVTGNVVPIQHIADIAHQAGALLVVDAAQTAGAIPIDVQEMHIDMLSASGHKLHAPKGIGFLYIRKGVKIRSFVHGGAQERSRRAGTENIPAIVGMAAALKEAVANMDENMVKIAAMRDRLIEGLSTIEHSRLNGDAKKRLPGNVNFCFEGIEGESLLLLLDEKGIEASSGSACTSGSLDPSHVLLAIGLPHEVAHGSLRLTLCEENTPEQIEYIIKEVPGIVSYLRNISPIWEELEKGEKKHVI